jgi:hypothetical protein
MKSSPGESWTPSRELLAAFADGELDDRPHLAGLVGQIETWLAAQPDAFADLEAQMELTRLMAATVPEAPTPATWATVWARVLKAPGQRLARWKLGAGILATAAAAAVVFAVIRAGSSNLPERTTPMPTQPPELIAKEKLEVLEVVTADEVEIIRVGGADTSTLVNVQVPITCPLELLDRNEVEFRPPANNAAGTEIRQAGSAPVVWTPLPRERDDDDKN